MISAERTGVHVWRLAYAVDQIKGVVCHTQNQALTIADDDEAAAVGVN